MSISHVTGSARWRRCSLVVVLVACLGVAGGGIPVQGAPGGDIDRSAGPAVVRWTARYLAVSADSATDAWAVGYDGPNADHPLVEHWDGTSWTRVASPAPGYSGTAVTGVIAFSPTDAWAVGYYNTYTDKFRYRTLVIHWDGTEWTQVPSPNVNAFSILQAVSGTSPSDLWAVGWSEVHRHGTWTYLTLAMHWDGSTWQTVPTPVLDGDTGSELLAVSAAAPDDAWAAGCSLYAPDRSLYLHWNGTKWAMVTPPSGRAPTCVTAVSVIGAHNAWSVTGSQAGDGLVNHWGGSRWRLDHDLPQATMSGVDALAADDVWAVGNQGACCGYRSLGLHWDGVDWTPVLMATPRHGRSTNVVAVHVRAADDAWAVGSALKTGRNIAPLIEHWDGASWTVSKAVR